MHLRNVRRTEKTKKRIKKLTALFCAAAVLLAGMPAAFAASDEVIATGTGGEGITWTLTVYAPSGSTAEKAATGCGIPFVSTDEPDDSFLGKVKQVWEKIKAFFVRIFNLIKGLLKIG